MEVVYLNRAGNSVAGKSGKIPPFHNRMRELCHGIGPVFLRATAIGSPVAVGHAALCVAKQSLRRGAADIQACQTTSPALPRAEPLSRPHPQASLCGL